MQKRKSNEQEANPRPRKFLVLISVLTINIGIKTFFNVKMPVPQCDILRCSPLLFHLNVDINNDRRTTLQAAPAEETHAKLISHMKVTDDAGILTRSCSM